MHLEQDKLPTEYLKYTRKKVIFIALGIILILLLLIISISVGAVNIPPIDVLNTLLGFSSSPQRETIIWNIRLPQALTGIVTGIGLAACGVALQSILRNPLGEPYTLGISHAAAFGATFSVMVLGAGAVESAGADAVIINNPAITTICAFLFSMLATVGILMISRIRGASPEVMILAGVAISALFTSATMFLQYFASDVQLAAVVFWTFGDLSRADWGELGLITAITILIVGWFFTQVWNFNAIDAGDETARSLGINVRRLRLIGMVAATLLAATTTALLGVIGFIGLIAPHITRRIIGDDNRFLLPGSCIVGAIVLLAADCVARILIPPHVLPVAVLTSFLGAPVFIWLLVKGRHT
ncbi:MAG TPA: iron ABC transporter permease [Methanospirillum sp.]|nr:iron ABC transporter permease [Methanospirillum sp.]